MLGFQGLAQSVLGELENIPFSFQFTMAVTANNSCELRIEFLADGVLNL